MNVGVNYFLSSLKNSRLDFSFTPFVGSPSGRIGQKIVIGLIAIALQLALDSALSSKCKLVSPSDLASLSTTKKLLIKYLFIVLNNKLMTILLSGIPRALLLPSPKLSSPYYYTILSNKYVVNDDDTHWTGWITRLLSTQKRGRAVTMQGRMGIEI